MEGNGSEWSFLHAPPYIFFTLHQYETFFFFFLLVRS